MKYLLFSAAVLFFTPAKETVKAEKHNLRLPVLLQFKNVELSLKTIFREQFVARGIDTISSQEGLRLMAEEQKNKMENALRAGNFNARTTFDAMQPRYYIIGFRVTASEQGIDMIAWKAYPFPDTRPDTTSRQYIPPDSLRQDPQRAIAGCIDVVLKSRVLK
ncbi:MAG: hypothetical protein JWQ30_1328 [Sediminibacterium sp.]|nr:hypothetical protein [Sediminibacterium sp.]